MKKVIFVLLFVLTLNIATPRTYAAGLPVFDAANFGTNLKDSIVQGYQLVKETITAAGTTITAVQQTLETVNNTILIPMASAMAVAQILSQKGAIENLVLGALGTPRLLISNPSLYIKNQGIMVINANLGNIANSGPFGNSILNVVLLNGRFNSATLQYQIAAIGSSNILVNEQRARCTDAALSAQARRDVTQPNGTYLQSDYIARKIALNNALCGNINDPNVQAALRAVTAASPSWGTWLATTGGDNAYTKAVLTQQAVDRAAEQARADALADLNRGGGIKSKTTCVKRATYAPNGQPYAAGDLSAPCIQEQILQTSNVISDAFKKALSAPVDILKSAIAPGQGVISLINTALTTYALVQSISNSADALGGGTTSGGTTAVTISTPTNDLANNPGAKAAITSAPKEQLQSQKGFLVSLADTDAKFLITLASYQSAVNDVKACYDNLSTYDEAQGRPQLTTGQNFYNSKTAIISEKRNQIITEQGLIATANALINNTITQIDASFSTQGILNIFTGYQNQVTAQGLPNSTTAITREGEYVTFSGDLQGSLLEGGEIFTLKADCNSLRQQIEQQRAFSNGGAGGI
jgi:hypothetical protein